MRLFARHWFPKAESSISAMSSQLPCFEVWGISRHFSKRRASASSNASSRDAILWVLRDVRDY